MTVCMNRDENGLCELRSEAADSGLKLCIDTGGKCTAAELDDCEFYSGEDIFIDAFNPEEDEEELKQEQQDENL